MEQKKNILKTCKDLIEMLEGCDDEDFIEDVIAAITFNDVEYINNLLNKKRG